MIRVRKNLTVPKSLQTGSNNYNAQDVQSILRTDHDEKCYLCERRCVTDYEIEHIKSKENHPSLITEWTNLFLACSYCNGKKLNNFDDILNPVDNNIEDIITHNHETTNGRVQFTSSATDTETVQTINLLTRIFNGAGNMRKIREQAFYNYFRNVMNTFSQMLIAYLTNQSAKNQTAVRQSLNITEEFLGFKYHLIKSHPELYAVFKKDMMWNRA